MGFDYSANIATQPIQSVAKNTKELVDMISEQDSILYDTTINLLNTAVLAYALDPIGTGVNFYARYGLFKKFDLGYKNASGTSVFDARYQFMGSTKTFDEEGEVKGTCGSIGLQYSSQKYDLPEWTGLNKVQGILGLTFKRKDILVPVIFSRPFGFEEEYGCMSYGLVYSHSFIKYSFDPKNINYVAKQTGTVIDTTYIPKIDVKTNYPSIGIFTNIKFGYKYVFGLISLAVYYQNYGTYQLLSGDTVRFKGFSFVPSAGLVVDIPFRKIFAKKKNSEEVKS